MSLTIPSVSREYIYVPNVRAFAGQDPVNVLTLTVEFAFTAIDAKPVTWLPGSWSPSFAEPTARIMVGPGANALARGGYDVWIRITGATEQPARKVGQVTIY